MSGTMRTTRRPFRLVGPILSAMLLAAMPAGCAQDKVRAPYTPNEDLLPLAEWPKIIEHQPLPLRVPRDGVVVVPSDGRRTMQVIVALRNVSEYYVPVRYRVLFYDATGSQVTRNPVWKQTSFPPRGPGQIEASAISIDAVDYRIEIAPL